MRAQRQDLPVLGWKEEIALPDWSIPRLRVKLDTGAKTSAIGVLEAVVVGSHRVAGDELPILRLVIPLSKHNRRRTALAVAPVVGYKSVRDTGARAERRPVVRTRLICGPLNHDIDVTVTNRSGMNFRMILGRDALARHAVVDPGLHYTAGRQPET